MSRRETRDARDAPRRTPRPPRIAMALMLGLVPLAERDEVAAELEAEFSERLVVAGKANATRWFWQQTVRSLPALVRRSWWRGWTGFEPRANRMRPGGFSMESWIMDARYAARRLVRRPLYATLAVLTLALGIGGTAAIFGIARTILLDPLPYRAEQDLASFWMPRDWTEQEFLHLRGRFPGFVSVAAYYPDDATLEMGDGPARLVPGLATSAELFTVLGVAPALGTGFQTGQDVVGAEPVAVLSHGLWRELGGDRAIIGRTVRFDGIPRTIVGVMPPGFWFPNPTTRVWLAQRLSPENRSGNYALVGRVAPGQRVEAMGAPLETLRRMLDERFDYPAQWDKTREPSLTPLRTFLVGSMKPALVATLTAMGLILLIACANVAALMLGQVEGRTTELAVRSALGANRVRLTQQLVAEAALLGIGAGITGGLLAAAAFRTLVAALPLGAWGESASLDWGVFGVAMVAAVVASAMVAIAPTVAMWRSDVRETLGGARTGGIVGRGGRLEGALVVAEVALAVVMAAGAGLLIRSVTKLYAIHPGVETAGVGVMDVTLPNDMPTPQRRQRLNELVAAIDALPGVASVGMVQRLPLRGGGWSSGMAVEGEPPADVSTTYVRFVNPQYLETVGVALRDGRMFTEADRTVAATADADGPAIVNEALVKKYFDGQSPIGRRIANGFGGWVRVVGVVGNVAEGKLTDPPSPARYMLVEELGFVSDLQAITFRTEGRSPESALDDVRQAVHRIAPSAAVQEVTTLGRVLDLAIGPARQVMTLLTILTTLALVLGAVGVYGVIAHFVSRRSRDWGVRLALGMMPSRVVRMIVARGAALVMTGIVLGIAAFVALARLLGALLYEVGAADPYAMIGATAVLLVVGVLAAVVPAIRASRTDPAMVLRES